MCESDFGFVEFVVVFFFKQKTAYEMRISDWSSDVCSSDLHDDLPTALAHRGQVPCGGRRGGDQHRQRRRSRQREEDRPIDRKSVVSGQSVSVRVDLGGRRDIKTNTVNTTHSTNATQHTLPATSTQQPTPKKTNLQDN